MIGRLQVVHSKNLNELGVIVTGRLSFDNNLLPDRNLNVRREQITRRSNYRCAVRSPVPTKYFARF